MTQQELFRQIPSVDRLRTNGDLIEFSNKYPHTLMLNAIRQTLRQIRQTIESNPQGMDPEQLSLEKVIEQVKKTAVILDRSSLRPVINATGVIIHTNLGRSLLAEKAMQRFSPIAGAYSNLEFDLDKGERGSRHSHVEGLLKELTGAEAGMVVNNNAAAVLVALETLARDRNVIVSRGQLVEIGGSFRVPDVMAKSGARMVEVGTTNKTHLADYEQAIGPDTALLLLVHQSNFQIIGFSAAPERVAVVALGKKYNIPVMEDLGSGCLLDLSKFGLIKEPTVPEVLSQGVDLVCFSGDKLLGGPQAGMILGKKALVEAIRKNQLSRALRIDKLTLVALEETLKIYRDENRAVKEIPTLAMIAAPYKTLRAKARRLLKMIGPLETSHFKIELMDGHSMIGGGALPQQELPTCLISLIPGTLSAVDLEQRLRTRSDPPIISRIEKDRALLDVRTIQDREIPLVARAVRSLTDV
ncbi:MAG: L-seryl-tRNA(Sec) selenium transferase [Desulfobacteraceae bacterium]|nr:MAG: L-seryl-tRNA(Sec) selenium transferase [Desulfobacteraceae bacterium]